jgi:NAD(P)-dependent dehydrogenase (short-subunit alcohol dehydrogenase family)
MPSTNTDGALLLRSKNAVVYGGGGAIGGAIARAFGREGAKVFLTGRTLAKLEPVAKDIISSGGAAETAQVDALDEAAVEKHLADIVEKNGGVDVSFNAIGLTPQQGIQGIPLTELSVDSFSLPIATYTRAHFVTARAAARRMVERRSGVILMHTPEPARLGAPLVGGAGVGGDGRSFAVAVCGIRPTWHPRGLLAHDGHPGDCDDRCRVRPSCQGTRHYATTISGVVGRHDAPTTLDHPVGVGQRGRLRRL